MAVAARRAPRKRSRGVAAIELALSLTFLMPLLFAIIDFGFYFYVGTNAEAAALAGARAAVRQSAALAGTFVTTNAAVQATQTVTATGGSGTACVGGAAYCMMNEAPLGMGGPAGPTTVTLRCLNAGTVPSAPVDPTWEVTVRVDFKPAVGFFPAVLPSGGPGKVRYTAKVASSN
jgi:Flp pilus assembly protein TadG